MKEGQHQQPDMPKDNRLAKDDKHGSTQQNSSPMLFARCLDCTTSHLFSDCPKLHEERVSTTQPMIEEKRDTLTRKLTISKTSPEASSKSAMSKLQKWLSSTKSQLLGQSDRIKDQNKYGDTGIIETKGASKTIPQSKKASVEHRTKTTTKEEASMQPQNEEKQEELVSSCTGKANQAQDHQQEMGWGQQSKHMLLHQARSIMQPRQRIFQPKYPSLQSQRRNEVKKVFVPPNSINVIDPVWLQNPKPTQTGDHIGWIASKSNLDAQGY